MENNNEVSKNEREAQNNANNIRNASDVAIASKHPLAMAAGGAVKVADRLTHGKASQKLGSAITKLNRHSPMGNQIQNASNKMSESGASDAIGNAASMKNGTPSGVQSDTQTSDVAQQKLKSSFANRAQNFMKKYKKKKSEEKSNDASENDSSNTNSSESANDDEADDEDSKKAKIRKKKIIKIIFSVIGTILPFLIMALVLIFIVGAIGSIISNFLPMLGNELYSRSAIKVEEDKYYEKLNKVMKSEYSTVCNNDEFDSNYFHVLLVYHYYLKELEADDLKDIDVNNPNYQNFMNAIESDNLTNNDYDSVGIPKRDYELFNNVLAKRYIFDNLLIYCHINYNKSDDEHSESQGYSLYRGMYDLISGGDSYLYRVYYPEANKRAQLKIANGVSRSEAFRAAYMEILDEIFDYAEMISNSNEVREEAVPDNFAIENVDANKSILVKDYLTGVIYANVDKSVLTNSEKLKAYTVIYTTNILSKNKISINTQSISSKSLDNFNYCDPNSDCNGKGAISDIAKNTINNSIEAVYGNVLVNADGQYDTLNVEKLYDADGSDFTTLLTNAYQGYTIRNAKEDVYDNGVNYGNEKILTPITFYDQRNYKSSFCGLKNETIARSGCGVTAMAMIVSTYENNKKYDPVYMSEEARKKGHCASGNGTYYSHFTYQSKVFGYKYLAVKKTSDATKLNLITTHLRKGHFVIVHVGKGQFTSGGHYMVIGGIDPSTKSVYIYDPYNSYNSVNRKSGTGWYKFSDILKQTKPAKTHTAFYIIWKE